MNKTKTKSIKYCQCKKCFGWYNYKCNKCGLRVNLGQDDKDFQKLINKAPWNDGGAKILADIFEKFNFGERKCRICGYEPERQRDILNLFFRSIIEQVSTQVRAESFTHGMNQGYIERGKDLPKSYQKGRADFRKEIITKIGAKKFPIGERRWCIKCAKNICNFIKQI